jgi:subtilisin family serine protease
MRFRTAALSTAGLLALAACADDATQPLAPDASRPSLSAAQSDGSYLIIANGNDLPTGLADRVRAAGGTITRTVPEIGLAVVSSSDPKFAQNAAGISGVRSVVPDVVLPWIEPAAGVDDIAVTDVGNPPASGDDDPGFNLQWGHDAVDAPEAWNAGFRGKGARVFILDSGIDADHPDLAPNLNKALSTSFVAGEGYDVSPAVSFNHGTHVAGTVAAADNGYGTIGIAPEAEIVAVKVLSERTGSGSFAGVAQGIVYAGNNGADVINMSLGATLQRRGLFDRNGNKVANANDIAELANLLGRATTYAYQQGSTVIVSAGNSAIDRDHDADVLVLPADAPHVIQIAATGPLGWGQNPSTNLDTRSYYSNYGQSRITFAAPGGTVDFSLRPGGTANRANWPKCVVAGTAEECWRFDMVYSTNNNGGATWAQGTSMAAPHASGVAALIVGKNGGSMAPSQVEAALRASSDDIDKPGKDDLGHGRVNAYRDVQRGQVANK